MKANNYISKGEHKLLLIVAFIALVFAFTSFTLRLIETHNIAVSKEQKELQEQASPVKTSGVSFGLYDMARAPVAPFFCLLEIFILLFNFFSLLKAKKFFLSSFFTTLSFSIFVFWFIGTRCSIDSMEVPSSVKGLDRILSDSTNFDFIVLFLVSILLFWQISILLRMLIKTLQRKTELP